MTAASGALHAAVADKLAVGLEMLDDATNKMFFDIDPYDLPDDIPIHYHEALRAGYLALIEARELVAEAGATADAGAQAQGELPTTSMWLCRPAGVAPLYALLQGGAV